ncbi:VWA domain-containing protein [Microbulbifer epialgicus]|uniref:VWA domain-containing protein n=1 Tax=Microbulbifer epialgicus TaxID=393907 RepID=A0ABV4NZ82_9GAMM
MKFNKIIHMMLAIPCLIAASNLSFAQVNNLDDRTYIAIGLDSSGGVSDVEWSAITGTAINLINNGSISGDDVWWTVSTFSESVNNIHSLDNDQTRSTVINAIAGITSTHEEEGFTHTDTWIESVLEEFELQQESDLQAGLKGQPQRIAILFTDGYPCEYPGAVNGWWQNGAIKAHIDPSMPYFAAPAPPHCPFDLSFLRESLEESETRLIVVMLDEQNNFWNIGTDYSPLLQDFEADYFDFYPHEVDNWLIQKRIIEFLP